VNAIPIWSNNFGLSNIATTGLVLDAFSIWKTDTFPLRTIQLPYYHHSVEKMKVIFKKQTPPLITQVLSKALLLAGANDGCRVKINYVLLKNFNDDPSTVATLLGLLAPFRDDIVVKLSFLNPTLPSERLSLCSPQIFKFHELFKVVTDAGFSCYIFGTEEDAQIGCGQLAVQSFRR